MTPTLEAGIDPKELGVGAEGEARPRIANAHSWEELEAAVAASGGLKGTERLHSVDKLLEQINLARQVLPAGEGAPVVNAITRTEGLRDKVWELIEKTRNEQQRQQ